MIALRRIGLVILFASLTACGDAPRSPSSSAARPPTAIEPNSANAKLGATVSPHMTQEERFAGSSSGTCADVPAAAVNEDPEWLVRARQDPDPDVRIAALEAWRRQPTESIDTVTFALVDEDESVRARAQELFNRLVSHD